MLVREKERHKLAERAVNDILGRWGLCEYVIVHTILGGSPVILRISLGGKPKWLPLKFGYHDVMRTSPIKGSLPLLFDLNIVQEMEHERRKLTRLAKSGEMVPVLPTPCYPKFNGSYFSLPPSSIHRMTGWVTISCEL